jgi:hypothetical protein
MKSRQFGEMYPIVGVEVSIRVKNNGLSIPGSCYVAIGVDVDGAN